MRGQCCAALAQAHSTGALPRAESPTARGMPERCAPFRAPRDAHEWVGYAQAPCADPAHVLADVGRSPHRVAIAHHRSLDVRDGGGRVASRHRRQDHRVQTMTRAAAACIRRCLWHGLPRGCLRLRHDGLLANRHQARAVRRCRALVGQPSEPPPRRPQRVVQGMQAVTGVDRTPCPPWGARPLVRRPLPPRSPPAASRGTPVEVPLDDAS